MPSFNKKKRLVPNLASTSSGLSLLHNKRDGQQSEPIGRGQFDVDIVAVHGVNGGAFKTWTHENGQMWLRDFLPKHVLGARIFTFGYDAGVKPTLSTGVLKDFARILLENLNGVRRSNHEKLRSIIFVCHSMGGLVVKKAIVTAHLESNLYGNIYDSVKAVLFLATPHRGSAAASFPTILTNAVNAALEATSISRIFGRMRSDLLKTLQVDSSELTELATSFKELSTGISITSFIEQNVTPPLSARVVDDVSGIMNIPRERVVPMPLCNHREICRFDSEQDGGFKSVLNVILDEIETIPKANDPELPELFLWLSTAKQEIYHERARNLRQGQTCQWLLQGKDFEEWLYTSSNAFLWLHGIPGAGKTILASSVIDHIQSNIQNLNPGSGFAYHYCDYKNRERQKPSEIIGNLVKQLCLQNKRFLDAVEEYYASTQKSYPRELPNANTLVDIIIQQAGHFRQILLVIDAMDECPNREEADNLDGKETEEGDSLRHGPNFRETLLEMIEKMYKSSNKTIKFLIIVEGEKVTKDIELHVKTVLQKYIEDDPDWLGESAQEMELHIRSTLVKKANGMFLFAALQLHLLRDQISDRGIQYTLDNLPNDLNHTYLRLLRGIKAGELNNEYIIRILTWLALSTRPITLEELSDAISVNDGQVSKQEKFSIRNFTLLTRVCGPLVRTDLSTNEISLAHFSLKEFLISGKLKGTEASKYHIDLFDANLYLAKTSLTYLSFQDFALPCKSLAEMEERRKKYPFLDYAVMNGGVHLGRLAGTSEELIKLLDALFFREILHEDIPDYFYESEDRSSSLKLTVSLLIPGVEGTYPRESGVSVSANRVYAQDILDILEPILLKEAARRPNCQSWLQLFQYSSDTTMQDNPANITPLYFASLFGWEAGTEAILQANRNRATTSDLNHALRAAAMGDHCGIIRLLEKSGAEVLANSEGLGSALQSAAYCGNMAAIETLLDLGAEIEEECNFYRPGGSVGSAFQGSATSGNEELVKLLLRKGADINSTRGWLGTPLQAVTERGMHEMAELLIDNGADATIPGGYYGNALHSICRGGWLPILKLVLERGADTTRHLGAYGDALQVATIFGSLEKVELLLEYGAPVNAPAGQFGTAIQAAAVGGNESVMQRLLEHGADPNSPGSWLGKDDTTHTIWDEDHGRALLLVEGEGFYATNCSGMTDGFFGPSMKSAVRIHEAAHNNVYLLFEHEPTQQSCHLGNPLQAAAFKGSTGLVKMLIANGAKVNTVDGVYGTALQAAACQGMAEVVEILLSHGASPNLRGGRYGSPLAAAIAHNHLDVIDLLCKNQADILEGDEHGWTAETWSVLFESNAMDFSENHARSAQRCLPHAWHINNKSPPLEVLEGGLVATHHRGKYEREFELQDHNLRNAHRYWFSALDLAASIIADHPVSPFGIYYFEVGIEKCSIGTVGVGFCDKSVPRFRMPGSVELSWGYRGDDGSGSAEGDEIVYDWPKFGQGDVVGCGINWDKNLVFFSYNGKKLEPEMRFRRSQVYPVLSILDGKESEADGTSIRANFDGPFKLSLDTAIEKELEYLAVLESHA